MNRQKEKHRLSIAAIAGATYSFVTLGACGETVSFLPLKDNTLFQDVDGSVSSGLGEGIFAGRTGSRANFQIRRATIAFDFAASIPPNATITGATLRLFLESAGQNAGGTSVSLHELAADWGEGTSVGIVGNPASATNGDATWLHRFYSTTFWSEPGGDFDTVPSATTTIEFPFRFYEWTGAGLIEDVQEWLVNPAANFGWIIVGEEGELTAALRFDSRESTITANRPELVVSYTIPEPTSLALLTGAVVLVLGLARRR